MPMWIPQIAMSWGAIVFTIAFIDLGIAAFHKRDLPDAGITADGGRGD
jgi:hypothetical protein